MTYVHLHIYVLTCYIPPSAQFKTIYTCHFSSQVSTKLMSPHFCSPDMIASHFLHAYIVVQPIDPCTSITRYRVSVVAQRDVPPFGPPLPAHSAIFDKGLAFKDFLLAKLINGERACYQATKFQALHQRTRATLLVNLAKELREQTIEYINSNYQSSLMLHMSTATLKEASKSPSPSSSGRLFTSVKRALKHVGSTKHEFQRHASAGSLSEVVNMESASVTNSETAIVQPPGTTSASRKNTTSSTGSTEDQSVKADSGHGDSDNSFPSSPQLSQCRKKLSTSQPHLSTLSDHLPVGGHHAHPHHSNNSSTVMDTSSVEADDIIYEPRNRPRMIQRRPALQLPKGSGPSPAIDPDCHTVISGAVTTIPVGGSPTSTTSSSGGSADRSSTASSSTSSNSASASNSVTRLHQDISRLRVDKLELLRQALSAQHEVRQLRQREAQLETDLALAAAEIRRLKSQLKKENHVIAAPTNSTNNGDVTSKVVGVASPKQSSTTVVRPPARSTRKTVHMQIPL